MILLIDNYDSFSYNLFQMVGEIEPDIRVIRNDEMSIEEIRELMPDRIIISPGPGRPENAGIIIDAARILGRDIPVLGVCLGHQAICAAFGADITYARRLMHGKQSVVKTDQGCGLFAGLPEEMPVARYHSLAVAPESLPDELMITAVTIETAADYSHIGHDGDGSGMHQLSMKHKEFAGNIGLTAETSEEREDRSGMTPEEMKKALKAGGEIMAVKHIEYPIFGLQFHPESILTPYGKEVLKNFIFM